MGFWEAPSFPGLEACYFLGKKRWGVALDFHDLSRDMKIVHLMCRISAINSNRIARILQRWEKKQVPEIDMINTRAMRQSHMMIIQNVI